jgi:hypothetical protein
VLQKVIPLLNEEDEKEISFSRIIVGGEYRGNITIPLTRSAAQAELDFLSSITDLKTTSRELVNRAANIERWKIKHDFSNSILVRISEAEPETISRSSLFLSILFVILILGIGFVHMLLSQYKYHRDNLQ